MLILGLHWNCYHRIPVIYWSPISHRSSFFVCMLSSSFQLIGVDTVFFKPHHISFKIRLYYYCYSITLTRNIHSHEKKTMHLSVSVWAVQQLHKTVEEFMIRSCWGIFNVWLVTCHADLFKFNFHFIWYLWISLLTSIQYHIIKHGDSNASMSRSISSRPAVLNVNITVR